MPWRLMLLLKVREGEERERERGGEVAWYGEYDECRMDKRGSYGAKGGDEI